MVPTVLHILLAAAALFLIGGTLINFSKHPHWFVRIWDFPRLMTAFLAGGLGLAYAIFFHARWYDWAVLIGLAFVVARQLYMIFPYTPVAKKTVKRSTRADVGGGGGGGGTLRLVISNILMENREFD